MSKPFSTILGTADQFLIDLFSQETPEQVALRQATIERIEYHQMMSTPEQVQFLAFLIRMMGVRRVIEVGVFSGYGTLAMAQALPADGELIACDHNEQWPLIGQPFWQEAGVDSKIVLQIAPALETLQALLDEGQAASFDFIFVDADKICYADYAELAHVLLRPGGLAIFDNVIWVGPQRVVDEAVPATRSVAAFLKLMSADERFESTLIPIAQGMLLARKREYNKSS